MSAAPAPPNETPGSKTTGMTLLSIIGTDAAKPAPKLKMVIDQFDRWTNPTDALCNCSWVTVCCADSPARSVA